MIIVINKMLNKNVILNEIFAKNCIINTLCKGIMFFQRNAIEERK